MVYFSTLGESGTQRLPDFTDEEGKAQRDGANPGQLESGCVLLNIAWWIKELRCDSLQDCVAEGGLGSEVH